LNRRSLFVIAAILAAVAVLLAVSGGVRATVGGFRISARSPVGASVAALAVVVVWWVLARRAKAVDADLESAWSSLEQHSSSMIALLAILSGVVTMTFATNSAAGADASGYLSEAAQWASGQLFYRDALAGAVGAVDPWLTAPLGWRPSPLAGLQSPTYPPGLPLLMAVPYSVGGTTGAGFILVVSAAAAVWATGLLAARLAGGAAGVIAAIAIAVSPILLFQSIQPMSDVPVTTAWLLTWVLLIQPGVGLALAGTACAAAVLIRPNLAPLAAVPLFLIGWNVRRIIRFSIPVALAGVTLMWLQWQWYGSPFRSGYGTADELFAIANVGANASRYFSWLAATSPALLIAPIGVAMLWRHAAARALAAFAALVVLAYLVYAVFDVWSYLRFLLPALAVAAVFAGGAIALTLRRLPVVLRPVVTLVVALSLLAHGVSQARALDTFRLANQQRRVERTADFIATTLPADAVIVSGEQSGSLRYYTGRSILRWDAASPDSLSAALSALNASDRTVVVALDAWEREPFRAKFHGLDNVSLEWPAAFEAGTSHRTHVWRLSDRDRFLRGERVQTVREP
jgi:hypothetical protein